MPTPSELLAIYSNQSQVNSFFIDKMKIINVLSYANNLTIDDGITEATKAIQSAINYCYSLGGGIVYVPTGTFMISQIKLRKHVYLKGVGSSTVLKSIPNNTSGKFVTLYDDDTEQCGVLDLVLHGDRNNQTQNLDGLYLSAIDSNKMDYYDSRMYFANLLIKGFVGYPLYLHQSHRGCAFYNVHTLFNNGEDGFYIGGTDNFFTSCTAAQCGKHGFFNAGSNNNYVNCKAFYTGNADSINSGDGFHIRGTGSKFTCCEAQECGRHGFTTSSAYANTLSSCLSDTNGRIANGSYGYYIADNSVANVLESCNTAQRVVLAGRLGYALYMGTTNIRNNSFKGAIYAENVVDEPIIQCNNVPITNTVVISGMDFTPTTPNMYLNKSNDGVIATGYYTTNIGDVTGNIIMDYSKKMQKVEITGGTTTGQIKILRKLPVVPNDIISGMVRGSCIGDIFISVQISFYQADGTYINYFTGDEFTGATFQNGLIKCVVPSNAAYCAVEACIATKDIGSTGTAWIQCINAKSDSGNNFEFAKVVVYNPPSISSMGVVTTIVNFPGVSMGDKVNVTFDKTLKGAILSCYVGSNNNVTVVFFNPTVSAIDIDSGNLKLEVVN